MLDVIKTAIITIIISFISGLLLDYYKNLAPRILCNIGNGIPIHINNKNFYAYIITVSNTSNKTIHELTLDIQSSQGNLMSTDAKITKGLKFDSSIRDNILDFYIPFLSKGDKFSVTVYIKNQYAVHNKPVIAIRAPENFKEIHSSGQNKILALLFNVPKNINQIMKKNEIIVSNKVDSYPAVINTAACTDQTINRECREVPYGNKKLSKNNKAMIVIVSIILVIITGVLWKSCLQGISANGQASSLNTAVPSQSNAAAGTSANIAENSTRNTTTKAPLENSTGNSAAKTSSENSTRNTSGRSSSWGATENTTTKSSSEDTTGNTAAKQSSENATGNNSAAKPSQQNTTENTTGKSSQDITTGNTAVKSSSENAAGNSGN